MLFPTHDELKLYFESTLMPKLQQLERRRRKIYSSAIVYGILSLAFILFGIYGPIFLGNHPFTGLIPGILIMIIGVVNVQPMFHRFVADFKHQIIKSLVNFLDPGFQYNPHSCITEAKFREAGMVRKPFDLYSGDDLVKGKIGATDFEFSEIHAQRKIREPKDRSKNDRCQTVFKGVFFRADFNKSFVGKTFVLTDIAEKYLGTLGQSLQSWKASMGQLVKLEDPEFEKSFAVYANDPTEARYILSPSLMKRIVDFKRLRKIQPQFSFAGNSVYLIIPLQRNLFEPSLNLRATNFFHVKQYYEDLCMLLGIVEDLNLNTRIWTKE